MAKVQILYWHDIPLQVKARDRSSRVSRPLPERFQVAVDRAAMAAGLTGSEVYTDGFHWSQAEERPGSASEVVEALVAELEDRYREIDWRRTAENLSSPAVEE